jgi:hypothetical protein
MRQLPKFVQGVEVSPWQPGRLALIEVAAQADVAVGEREDGFTLSQYVEVEAAFTDAPGLDVVGPLPDHAVFL